MTRHVISVSRRNTQQERKNRTKNNKRKEISNKGTQRRKADKHKERNERKEGRRKYREKRKEEERKNERKIKKKDGSPPDSGSLGKALRNPNQNCLENSFRGRVPVCHPLMSGVRKLHFHFTESAASAPTLDVVS